MTHSIGESSAMAARRRTRAEFFADTNNDDDNYVLVSYGYRTTKMNLYLLKCFINVAR